MAEDNKMKRCPVTLQPDIEELLDWNITVQMISTAPPRPRKRISSRNVRAFLIGRMHGAV